MAVMRTFCGCLTTKTGSLSILLFYGLFYLLLVIFSAIQLNDPDLQSKWEAEIATDPENDCATGDNKDTWWCKAITESKTDVKTPLIVGIVIESICLITNILAIFGTSQNKQWFMLPWIIVEFLLLAIQCIGLVLLLIMMTVYWGDTGEDTSGAVMLGVAASGFTAFVCYVWLCVVSHFQILREMHKLGINSAKSMENVVPFVNEDDTDSFNDELTLHKEVYPTSPARVMTPLPGGDDDDYHPEKNHVLDDGDDISDIEDAGNSVDKDVNEKDGSRKNSTENGGFEYQSPAKSRLGTANSRVGSAISRAKGDDSS